MTFRVNAINFALTYPQANDLSKEQLRDGLLTLQPIYMLIGEEQHNDGGRHFHVYFKAGKKLNVRDPKYFDVAGRHANIQSCKDIRAWMEYCRKEDKHAIEYGDPGTKRTWGQVLATCTEEEFLSAVQAVSPRDFILSADRVSSFAKRRFSEPNVWVPKFTEFHPTSNMQRWMHQRLHTDRPKSLFIEGASRLGKTAWARSLGRHMYFNGMIDIELWDDQAEYAIFDDVQWEYFPQKKGFIGAQDQITITDKYKKKRTVLWGKPIIYLYNSDYCPLLKMSAHEKEWLDENVIYTKVTNKLF